MKNNTNSNVELQVPNIKVTPEKEFSRTDTEVGNAISAALGGRSVFRQFSQGFRNVSKMDAFSKTLGDKNKSKATEIIERL